MTSRLRTRTALPLLVILLSGIFSGCSMFTGTDPADVDFQGPVLNVELWDDMLYIEAWDVDAEVDSVTISADGILKAVYTGGFRSIAYDLGNLGYGVFDIRVSAEDSRGNRSTENLCWNNPAYVGTEIILAEEQQAIRNAYGSVIAHLEIVRRETVWEPVAPDLPPVPPTRNNTYRVVNVTPGILYSCFITITGFDAEDNLLWTHRGNLGTLYPGWSGSFDALDVGDEIPTCYSITLYWY